MCVCVGGGGYDGGTETGISREKERVSERPEEWTETGR